MKWTLLVAAAMSLVLTPAFAKHRHGTSHHHRMGSQGSAGLGGDGTTTSSSSGPTMKTGAERSPTGGAPMK